MLKAKCFNNIKSIFYFNTHFSKLIYKSVLYICCIFIFAIFYGCSAFSPPTDYFQKTVEMEAQGEKSRYQTNSTVTETESGKSTKIIKKASDEPPTIEILKKSEQDEDTVVNAKKKEVDENDQEIKVVSSPAPLPNVYTENQNSGLNSVPIAISSDVIKTALEIAGINVRNVELVNGRVGNSKNSIRINFICESSNVVNDKFFTICAVIYHLNKSSKTVDVVIGIAEDSQTNLLGVLQSNTEDINAWMDNKITRAEWFSRITRKML